jgi:hypothetical protein
MPKDRSHIFIWIWQIGSLATFVYLAFFDGFRYNYWNWIIAIPVNMFLAEIWPVYWLIIRPLTAWLNS